MLFSCLFVHLFACSQAEHLHSHSQGWSPGGFLARGGICGAIGLLRGSISGELSVLYIVLGCGSCYLLYCRTRGSLFKGYMLVYSVLDIWLCHT